MRSRTGALAVASLGALALASACASDAGPDAGAPEWVRADGSADAERLQRDREACLSQVGVAPVGSPTPQIALRQHVELCLRNKGWQRP